MSKIRALSILSQLQLQSIGRAWRNPARPPLAFNSFPVAARRTLLPEVRRQFPSFNSFLVAALPVRPHFHRRIVKLPFNSFLVAAFYDNLVRLMKRYTFNSFLVAALPVRPHFHRRIVKLPFNSFLVAAFYDNLVRLMKRYTFNSFLVAACISALKTLPISSESFNSFLVAAEALAACLLINLSFANFEVPGNSLAPPPDTCVGSRKPFPDSRRKEGIWRERNDV